MSKIARYAGNLPAFGSNAQGLERTVFGGTAQADDLTSQITDAFRRGWGIVGPSENPSLEDFNAAFYTLSQLISYQHQMGVPEWDAKQEYYLGSVCSYKGELYESLSNSNTGNEPPSAQWTLVITAKNGISKLGLGTAAKKDVGTGANQIPDMNSFASGSGANSQWYKFPGGMIVQFGYAITSSSSSISVSFPTAFLTSSAGGGVAYSVSPTSASNIIATATGSTLTSISGLRTFNTAGTQQANGVFWIAIGS